MYFVRDKKYVPHYVFSMKELLIPGLVKDESCVNKNKTLDTGLTFVDEKSSKLHALVITAN